MNELIKLNEQDVLKIVDMHIKHLPDGLLTAFGRPFLREFYLALNADPQVFILIERSGTEILGFITGGTSLNGIKRHFLENLPITLWLLRYSIFKPKLILRFMMSVKRALFKTSAASNSVLEAELYSLVVGASSQRKGIASKLYNELCNTFENLGIHSFEIIVGSELTAAQMFYESKGAVRVKTVEQGFGKRSYVYTQRLSKDSD